MPHRRSSGRLPRVRHPAGAGDGGGVAPKLLAAGIDCYLLALPPGMDVNAYALQAADPSQALGAIIRKAEWLGKGQSARAGCRCQSSPAVEADR